MQSQSLGKIQGVTARERGNENFRTGLVNTYTMASASQQPLPPSPSHRLSPSLLALERELRGIAVLNHRQRALIGHAIRHPDQRYTIKSHRVSHNVVYQTSRTDFLDLEKRGLLRAEKIGRTWYFTPMVDLEKKLAELS